MATKGWQRMSDTTPTSPAPPAQTTPTETPAWLAPLVEALAASIGSQSTPAWLAPLLENQQKVAETLATHTRPKQDDNPARKSPFNPRGDRDFPRPPLQCEIRLANVELDPRTLTYDEIELLNRLTPGEYWVRKTDGSEERVEIVPTMTELGDAYARLNIRMDVKDETGTKKHNWPSLLNLCRQLLGEPEVHPPPTKRTGRTRRAAVAGEGDLTDATMRDIARARPEIATALQSMMDRPTDRV